MSKEVSAALIGALVGGLIAAVVAVYSIKKRTHHAGDENLGDRPIDLDPQHRCDVKGRGREENRGMQRERGHRRPRSS